jgi:hypothetical protein
MIDRDGNIQSPIDLSAAVVDNVGNATVAFDGTNFLAITQTSGEPARMHRLTGNGALIDPLPGVDIPDSNAYQYAVAFGGGVYVVVYGKRPNLGQLFARTILPDATLGAEHLIYSGTGMEIRPSIAFDGTNFLVAWEHILGLTDSDILGIRLAPDATVLRDPFVISNAPELQHDSKVACSAISCLVTWADRRNFPGTPPGTVFGPGDMYGARIAGDDTVLDGPTQSGGIAIATGIKSNQDQPALAFTGTEYVVAWQEGTFSGFSGPTSLFASRVSIDGVVVEGSARVAINGPPQRTGPPLSRVCAAYGSAGGIMAWLSPNANGDMVVSGAQFYPLAVQ